MDFLRRVFEPMWRKKVPKKPDAVRIGVLGAARITPMALIQPATRMDDVDVVAVAARSKERAQEFATKHGFVWPLHAVFS